MYRQSWFEHLQGQLAPRGLNTWGVLDRATYDTMAPEGSRCADIFEPTRSILVVGSGGTLLWEQFMAHLANHPEDLTLQPHPLDHFVERSLIEHHPLILEGGAARVVPITANTPVFLDVRRLALSCGLGVMSPTGLLLHPHYGLWWAVRGVIFSEGELPPGLPLTSSPCISCPAPCITSCPADAVQPSGFVFTRCIDQHQRTNTCAATCLSRQACIAAPEHRYGDLQNLYHNARLPGRRALREHLHILHDGFEGQGPWP